MQALTVTPGVAGAVALREVPDPEPAGDALLVAGLAMGVCGTDREIVAGAYGAAPPGRDHLVLGHESLGRVQHAPPGSGFAAGDLVVGVVRRPDPEPCGACGAGEFDMCRNGRYTERGIKEADGYGSALWTVAPDYAVPLAPHLADVGVLLEPTSVVAKAWEQIARVGARSWFAPRRALVTGAGPIGLLAALLGVQRGLDVHVVDLATDGPKPAAVAALGATYHRDPAGDVAAKLLPDIVVEATGVGAVVLDAIAHTARYGIVCLTGVSAAGRRVDIDASDANRTLVLENDAVLGSVNANLRHFRAAAEALRAADHDWLRRLITRRIPVAQHALAWEPRPDDIKTVLTFA